MKFATLVLVAIAIAGASASSSSCIPTVPSAEVPSSIVSVFSSISVSYPSIYTIASAISVIELSSPTVSLAESTIEYYEQSYSSVVDEIESIYSYPSLYTDLSYVSELTAAYSSLASAVSYIESVESTQSALAEYQSTLQTLEQYYTTILSQFWQLTGREYPSIYYASDVISAATLTDSSIFASVVAVSTAVSASPTVSSAVWFLSGAVYSLPSTVVSEIITIVSSPSTVASSTVSSIESCYPTVYTELAYVTAFTYYYPSVVSDLVAYLSAASSVSGLGSAVSIIVSDQMPTFTYEVDVLSDAVSTDLSLSNDLYFLTGCEALSTSLYYAESTIEASFYNSYSAASVILNALEYPSLVTSPSYVEYYEESHESLVSAIDTVLSWESYYSSSASLFSSVESQLISAFVSYGTLLTAYSDVEDVTSPSLASASASLSAAVSVVSDLTYILSDVTYVIDDVPSLSCYESDIEFYAEEYPYYASYIWSVLDGNVYIASTQVSSFVSLIDSYYTLYTELEDVSIIGGQIDYSFLDSLESSFIYAAETDSSILTQYEAVSDADDSAVYTFTYVSVFYPPALAC